MSENIREREAGHLSDEQMMLLMAYADGELEGDELASVQALVEANSDAAAIVAGLGAGKDALRVGVDEAAPALDLSGLVRHATEEAAAVQLMAHVDGELSDEQREAARLDELLAGSTAAKTWVHDLGLSKRALHDATMADELAPEWSGADLSMVRGRVMTKLPAEKREAIAEEAPSGFFPAITAWLSDLGWGKTAVAGGVMAVALMAALVVNKPTEPPVLERDGPVFVDGDKANLPPLPPADGEPEVIIEDMESDGGTVIMQEGENPGEATIIWHIDPEEGEQGAG